MWSYDEALGDYVQQLDTQVTEWRLSYVRGWDKSYLVRFFGLPSLADGARDSSFRQLAGS